MNTEPVSVIPELILILILTFVNAFFSASEMAIISLNKARVTHLAEEGNEKAKLLSKLLKEPSKFLSTIQVGITLASFLPVLLQLLLFLSIFPLYLKTLMFLIVTESLSL